MPAPRYRVPLHTIARRTWQGVWRWCELVDVRRKKRVVGLETPGGHTWRLHQTAAGTFLEKWHNES